MIFLYLFIVFFEIGLFGFGGGYTILALIQGQVVNHFNWMTMGEFTDMLALSQMAPGPVEVNSTIYCGSSIVHNAGFGNIMSTLGSATAILALILPSLIIMILVCRVFMKYLYTTAMKSILMGLRPAILGLLAATILLLCSSDNFSTPDHPWQFWISIFLFIATIIGTKTFKIHPIQMIGYDALAGLLLLY
ncbi:MAG: chromate transporter [Prevotella sp.]|jgi:chromate transporter|nr:chromate transporter [Prevotella sp.]MCH3992467.1 chromate transporter [Prevotella sp.]MCI1474472.1 chromate transporter [Prevotella sp.]MCI1519683.1 chromate transporter [Prevotella sp.]MCI1549938.1 chromate transporter [Prevotella sp.]